MSSCTIALVALGLCALALIGLAVAYRRRIWELRAIFDLSQAGIAFLDDAGRIVRANGAFAALGGRDAAEVIGWPVHEVVSIPTDRDVFNAEIRTNRPDAYEVWALVSSRYVNDGSRRRRVVLAIDTTPIRTADRILARYDDELKSSNRRLAEAAAHDVLTGLPNRGQLMRRLAQDIAAAGDQGCVTVLFIDLDGFKPVNDIHGHDAGDAVLKTVAARMRGALRSSDMVARFGGDEFVIVAGGLTDVRQAEFIAEKLLRVLPQPIFHEGLELSVGASIGIAAYPSAAQDADDLLRAADEAMYDAKNAGRHRYAFHSAAGLAAVVVSG